MFKVVVLADCDVLVVCQAAASCQLESQGEGIELECAGLLLTQYNFLQLLGFECTMPKRQAI
jgi:hypothetical protein